MRIVDPHRTFQTKRDESELLPEAGDEVEAPADLVERFLIVDGPFEDGDGGYVHVGVVVLQVEEHRVGR
jgi:hypothetical protein